MRISSTDNPIYRRLKQLATSPRACREAHRTLIEGVHLLQAALDARVTIHTVVLRGAEESAEALALVPRVEAESKAKLIELAPALYDAISPVEHGAGVLAEIEFETPLWPKQIVDDAIYLDNVQDPGNVGTLLRTAAAAGVRHAIAGAGCAFFWSPKVMRAAMGAHFMLNLHEQIAPPAVRDAFAGEILAADVMGGEDLFTTEWGKNPSVWLFGGEGQGLTEEALLTADRRLRISIEGRVDSLNVAAAAAVCLFEQKRRREYRALR
ncbi:MAG TPA: RNA methyltransferase [Burkholderiaceae bacterium]|nr:RNA methyltransferase [Burkholderiaceae bacterium]